MSAEQIPVASPPSSPTSIDTASAGASSFWDRISQWASEHKAVVYTVAGVTVVATGAGIYYYASAPRNGASSGSAASEKKKAKKDKRKGKKAGDQRSEEEDAKTGGTIAMCHAYRVADST